MAIISIRRLKRLKSIKLLTGLVALLIVVGGILIWHNHHNKKPNVAAANQSSVQTVGSDANDQSPAKAAVSPNQSAGSSATSNQSSPAASPRKSVTPFIARADQNEVDAYISGIFEDGGTCTATMTKGSQTVTKTSGSFRNVSYTSCQPINLSGALSKGTWTLVVSYSSPTAEGKSSPTTIEAR